MRKTSDFMTRSHRTFFDNCKWWSRTTFGGSVDFSKMVHENEPTGHFTAKEGSDMTGSGTQYTEGYRPMGKFRFANQNVTIMTNDDVQGLMQDDIVLYHGELWIVAAPIRKIPHNRSSQFSVTTERTYVIELTNGGQF